MAATEQTIVPPNDGPVIAQIVPLPPLDRLKSMWRDLEGRAEPSYFLSWHWIGAWLSESGARPVLLVALRHNVIVGLALIGEDRPRFRRPTLYLNQAGAAEFDTVYIEYNDFLVDRTEAKATRAACLAALCDNSSAIGQCREIRWVACAIPAENMPRHRNMALKKYLSLFSPYVDLNAVRGRGNDLAALLSANTRYQIRRSIRLYEEMGELRTRAGCNKKSRSRVDR